MKPTKADEREVFGGFAGGPLVQFETVHQVAGDAVFLQHQGVGLDDVEGRVPLAAALVIGDLAPWTDSQPAHEPCRQRRTDPIPRPIRGATGAKARVRSRVMITEQAVCQKNRAVFCMPPAAALRALGAERKALRILATLKKAQPSVGQGASRSSQRMASNADASGTGGPPSG